MDCGSNFIFLFASVTKLQLSLCAQFKSGDRIVNGVDAKIEDHPWIVSIQIIQKMKLPGKVEVTLCGGVIIAANLIVSARHCFMDAKGDSKVSGEGEVKVGVVNKDSKSFVPFNMDTDVYVTERIQADIGIIILKQSLNFSEKVRPIKLPRDVHHLPREGDPAFISGWGHACGTTEKFSRECEMGESQDFIPDNLQTTQVKISANDALKIYQMSPEDNELRLAALGITDSGLATDQCQGDSGGPLECFWNGTSGDKYLCGLSSLGPTAPSCGAVPSGYVKIAHPIILSFIHSNFGRAKLARKSYEDHVNETRYYVNQANDENNMFRKSNTQNSYFNGYVAVFIVTWLGHYLQ